MLEFWNDPDTTARIYGPGRWLNMGDVGRIENGLLYINSRARDVIFVSSENVFPSEVENRLEEHDAVVEACVAGVEDPVTGQAVKAFVVLDGTGVVDEAALTVWCRGGLPAYKGPTCGRSAPTRCRGTRQERSCETSSSLVIGVHPRCNAADSVRRPRRPHRHSSRRPVRSSTRTASSPVP